MKLFPIFMIIWYDDVPAAAKVVGWAVVINNVEALKILLGCGYVVASGLAVTGALVRWGVGKVVLLCIGLHDGGDLLGSNDLWSLIESALELRGKMGLG
jgi:hypothetical protein